MSITFEEKLFSKINHDLRGSFVSILGYSGILSDPNEEVTESEIKEFVSRIDLRTKETFELLESFTNWLKLEQYPQSINKEEINLLESVTSVQSLFQNDFIKKNIEANINFDESIIISFDVQMISSLLKNLFSFINKSIKEKSKLKISAISFENKANLKFEYTSQLSEKEILPLTKLRENEIIFTNIPNEILFAKKFVELSRGSFDLNVLDENEIVIEIIIDNQ
ncbi:MAG: HAMP domain-containing histidine kinase [Ignavibacteriae bacterium]|nr:HAMP domain-containing histidine kinase [Ignavibacteriota bacterium]